MLTKKHYILLLAGLLLLQWTALAQSRHDLEAQRKRLLIEIEQTSLELSSTKKDRKAVLGRYITLQNQIRKRKQLISLLSDEVAFINTGINRSRDVVISLESDIDRLKQEYAQALRTAYRHKLSGSMVLFLLSADGLNDAFRRWQYIRQYEGYRRRQAHLIEETQATLARRVNELELALEEKESLLNSAKQQSQTLARDLSDKNQILKGLKQAERRLASQLLKKQEARQKLDEEIEAVIIAEMESRRNTSPTRSRNMTSALVKLSADFAENAGSLPWPVSSGRITKRFGTQPHPSLEGVKISNNGIDITTEPRSQVHAIFSGVVVGTSYIPGYLHTIIVQHGAYYSVYSNLDVVSVTRGDKINGGQVIGRLGQGDPEIHFELWKEKQRMNPSKWLAAN